MSFQPITIHEYAGPGTEVIEIPTIMVQMLPWYYWTSTWANMTFEEQELVIAQWMLETPSLIQQFRGRQG